MRVPVYTPWVAAARLVVVIVTVKVALLLAPPSQLGLAVKLFIMLPSVIFAASVFVLEESLQLTE